MKKILILFLICFTMVNLPVLASQWVEAINKTYIKIEKVQENEVYYWVKFLNTGKTKPIKNQKVKHELIYYVSNCQNNTIWPQDYYAYGVSGEVLSSDSSNYPQFQKIVPQSVGELLHNYACSYTNNYSPKY